MSDDKIILEDDNALLEDMDLGGSKIENQTTPIRTKISNWFKACSLPSSKNIVEQTLKQRAWLFCLVMVIVVSLYGLFYYTVFSCSRTVMLLSIAPNSVFLLFSLLLIPSMLLWGLIRAVYKPPESVEDTDTLTTAEKIIQLIEKINNKQNTPFLAVGGVLLMSVPINITMPVYVRNRIDRAAKSAGMNRSNYIVKTVRERSL